MTIALKRDRGDRFQVVGMSHVRFDRTGRVTFHQDYWDTGAIYERIPVLGFGDVLLMGRNAPALSSEPMEAGTPCTFAMARSGLSEISPKGPLE
jgi:hypothetical protein